VSGPYHGLFHILDFLAPTVEILRRTLWCVLALEAKQLQAAGVTAHDTESASFKFAGHTPSYSRCSRTLEVTLIIGALAAVIVVMYWTRDA